MTDISSEAVFKRLSEIFREEYESEDPLKDSRMRSSVRYLVSQILTRNEKLEAVKSLAEKVKGNSHSYSNNNSKWCPNGVWQNIDAGFYDSLSELCQALKALEE